MADIRPEPARPDAGFILIVVIWIAALFALITVAFVRTAQTHVRNAATLSQSTRAELLADSGVTLVMLDLIENHAKPNRARRFASNGSVVVCKAGGDDRLAIAVQDAAGRVNLNLANERLLQAFFVGLGAARPTADRLADAIIDFRDSDSDRRIAGSELPEYLAAGRARGPKNAPFDSLDELQQVLGFDPGVIEAMLPHVTLHSRVSGVDARFASPPLANLLGRGAEQLSGRLTTGLSEGRVPAEFIAASPQRTFIASVTARLSSGATYVRETVIEMPAIQNAMPALLVWKRANQIPDSRIADGELQQSLACW